VGAGVDVLSIEERGRIRQYYTLVLERTALASPSPELRTWRGFLEGRTSIDSTGIRTGSYAGIGIMVNI
jgi:hypothetical protein